MSELSQAERTAMERLQIAAITSAESRAVERGFLAARDYGRERERTLEDALETIEHSAPGLHAPEPRWRLFAESLQEIARDALAASQPEVLSERSDTELGEPEGQPKKAHNGIPDDYWREVPCGHPLDPVAVWNDDGYAVCHCGWGLNPSEGFEIEGAPGPVVLCGECGCHIAVPARPVQPDHGPGEPSDPNRCTYCGESFPVPVELHHAEADCAGLEGSNG